MKVVETWWQGDKRGNRYLHLKVEHNGRLFSHHYHEDSLKYGGQEAVERMAKKRTIAQYNAEQRLTAK